MSSAARKRMGSTYNRYTGDAGFRRATFTRRAEFYRRDLHQGCQIRGHQVRWRRHVQRATFTSDARFEKARASTWTGARRTWPTGWTALRTPSTPPGNQWPLLVRERPDEPAPRKAIVPE
jgi:hypothetical protein